MKLGEQGERVEKRCGSKGTGGYGGMDSVGVGIFICLFAF